MASTESDLLTQVIEASEPPPAFITERHRAALAYWQARRRDGRLPGRADIDPLDMPQLLSRVILLDVQADPLNFRYRLIGTVVRERLARDYTGARLREVAHQGPETPIWEHCARVVREARPLFNSASYVGPDRRVRAHQGLTLPLAADGAAVDMLLAIAEFAGG